MADSRVQNLPPSTDLQTARTDLTVVKRSGVDRLQQIALQDFTKAGDWRLNRVIVRNADDLPAAAGGVRQLADSTLYEFVGGVSVAEGLVFGQDTMLKGSHWARDGLIYTGTGAALRTPTGSNQAVNMDQMYVTAPSGSAVNLTGDIDQFLNMRTILFTQCGSVGMIEGYDTIAIKDTAFVASSGGLTIGGTTRKVFISDCPFIDSTTGVTDLTLSATLVAGAVDIDSNYFKNDDSLNNSIEVVSGASTGNRARLRGNAFIGAGTDIVGFSDSDANWSFALNDGQSDSSTEAGVSTRNNTEVTSVGATGVFTQANFGSGATDIRLERFTRSGNVFTYIGVEDVTVSMNAALAVFGANAEYEFVFAKNGTPILSTQIPIDVSNNKSRPVPFFGVTRLANGDTLEVQVLNNDNTQDITISDGSFVVTKT